MTILYTDICICGHSIEDHFQNEQWENDELVVNCGYCLADDCDCEFYEDITEENE